MGIGSIVLIVIACVVVLSLLLWIGKKYDIWLICDIADICIEIGHAIGSIDFGDIDIGGDD